VIRYLFDILSQCQIGPGGLAGVTANDRIRLNQRFVFACGGLTRMKTRTINMQRDARNGSGESSIAPVEMPGLDNHLCFALYAASNHMTRMFVPASSIAF
jgi:hypothetical protein